MQSLLATTLVAFVLAAVIHGKGLFKLQWAPTRHTWAAVTAAAVPAVFSGLALLTPSGSLAFNLLLWVLIFGVCGFAIPWAYVLLIEHRGASALGATSHRWKLSLLLSLLFAAGSTYSLLRQVDISRYDVRHILGAALHLNVGGLFAVPVLRVPSPATA